MILILKQLAAKNTQRAGGIIMKSESCVHGMNK